MENFYPRPPRGGRRIPVPTKLSQLEFLSTPSARRATASSGRPAKTTAYFYPRPPRGGRHQHADDRLRGVAISIHALREEGDHLLGVIPDGHADFYPRPPRGGRLALALDGREILHISIHALREEGDIEAYIKPLGLRLFLSTPSARRATIGSLPPGSRFTYFYPRPPRGGRPMNFELILVPRTFLSTPSARRATESQPVRHHLQTISIHALREEGDHGQCLSNPAWAISIHALREEGDPEWSQTFHPQFDFYPRPPRGGRQQKQRQNLYFQTNYTTFCTNLEEP